MNVYNYVKYSNVSRESSSGTKTSRGILKIRLGYLLLLSEEAVLVEVLWGGLQQNLIYVLFAYAYCYGHDTDL